MFKYICESNAIGACILITVTLHQQNFGQQSFIKLQKHRDEKSFGNLKHIETCILKYSGNEPVKYIIDIGGGYGVFDEEIKR